jgi:TP901 family phage tail tape measure protein
MGAGSDLIIRIATKGANLAQAQLNSLGKSSTLLGGKFGKLAKVGVAGLGLAMIGVAKAVSSSISAFADFDDKLTQSLAIMKTTEEQNAQMARTARQVATETAISATDSAEAYFFLASAGLDAEQSIAALPQVARFAQAGMFDMATATDLATDAQSALGLTVKDAQQNLQNLTRVTDVLVKANTLANATVQQFSEALTTKAGAALKVVNKDIEEGVAVLAAFADRGVKGAEAGDKLNQILRDIPRATAKNSEEFEKLGLQLFDNEGNMRNVADVIEELDRVLGPMSDELKASTLDQLGLNRGVADGIKILSGATDQIRNYENELRKSAGTTAEIAEKQLESFKAQVQILNNNLENLRITIGEDLVPALTEMVQQAQITVERFQNFKNRVGEVNKAVKLLGAVLVGMIAAAFGPIGIAIATVTAGIVALSKAIGRGNDKYAEAKAKADQLNNAYARQQYYLGFVADDTEKVTQANTELADVYDGQNLTVAELTNLIRENNVALGENTEEALKNAQAYEDSLLGGLQSVLNAYDQLQAMQDRIDRAETKRNKALEKQIKAEEGVSTATTELEKAKEELAKVQGLGAQITNEEALAIARQEEAIKSLKEAGELTKIQKLELAVLEDNLTKLKEEAVAISREEEKALDDVKTAEENLIKAKELQKEAINGVSEAQKELNKLSEKSARNLLEQAIAQENLTKALASFGTGTKGFEDALNKLAKITGEKIGEVNSLFGSLFNNASKLSTVGIDLGPSTSAGAGGGGAPQKFPATTTTTSDARSRLTAEVLGETNINIYNQGTNVGTSDEFINSVSTAFQEAKKRGVEFI